MNYQNFDTEDFIKDERFIAWVNSPDEASNRFWQEWLNKHPEKREQVEAAQQFILALDFEHEKPSDQDKKRMLNQIHQAIEKTERSSSKKFSIWWFRIAGLAALGLLAIGIYFFFAKPKETIYKTAYSILEKIKLPDGSEVVLNTNSSLKTLNHWENAQDREVWLEGEAYFTVNKSPRIGKPTFIVHTENLDIKVLGTQFNVNTRAEVVDVVLAEGKVQIEIPKVSKFEEKIELELLPGDRTLIEKTNYDYSLQKVNTAVFTAWKDRKLVFDETPLSFLKTIIEEQYGYEVIIDNPELLHKKLSGTIGNPNLDALIKAMEAIFNFKITKNEKQLIITE